MSLTQVTGPYPIFTDLDGSPLDDGYLYIGDQNDDPEINPIQVFWDSALTIPATQPIRTNSGYAWRNGTPGLLYTAGAFSITIRNKRNEFVLYSPVGYGFDPAAVSGAVVQNDFTGDGVRVAFTLSSTPSTKLATSVFINGVYQEKDSYSVSGNTLTFTVAPPLSSSIEVMTNETGVIGSTNASLVSYTAGFAGAVAQTVQTKLEQYVSVKDFGAVGDGVADDTAEIQAALDYAATANASVTFPRGTYLHSSRLIVKNGVRGLRGEGGVIKAAANTCGILLAGIQSGQAANVTNCDITDLLIDGGNYSFTAIEGQNVQLSNVTGNRIYNITDGYGILFRSYLAGGRLTLFVNISNNQVSLTTSYYGDAVSGIALDVLNAELNVAPYANETAYWQGTFTAAVPTYYADLCVVSDNLISGGYYGVSLSGAARTTITGNAVQLNTRNISVQNGSSRNVIANNDLSQSASSGIHMASGSSFNVVTGNKIANTSNGGEALIQAYLGCTDNVISSNQITAGGSTGNEYFIYIGPKCDRCVVDGNQCFGNAERGGILVESDWNDAVTNTYSYAYGKTLPGEWSNAALTNVVVRGNLINLTFSRPALMLFAIQGVTNSCNLTGCVADGNTVPTIPFYQFEIFEFGTAQVSTTQLIGNAFNNSATSTQFILPRGWAHFTNRANNQNLDTKIPQFTNADTSPSVAFGSSLFSFNNAAPTSVTYFDDAIDGVEISVRLDSNTTLVNNSSLMRLKGGVNAVGTSVNDIVTLRRTANIWFEVSRSF